MTATHPTCVCRGCARHPAPGSDRCWRCLDKGCHPTLAQRIAARIREKGRKP